MTAREPRDRHGDSRRVEFHINPQNVAGAEAEDQKERREKKKKGRLRRKNSFSRWIINYDHRKRGYDVDCDRNSYAVNGEHFCDRTAGYAILNDLESDGTETSSAYGVTLSSWLARDRSVAPYRSPVLCRCSERFENKAEERKRSETIVSRYVSRDFTAIVDSWDVADRARSRDRGWDRPMKGFLDSQLKKKNLWNYHATLQIAESFRTLITWFFQRPEDLNHREARRL